MEINGETKTIGLIGCPVEHTLSPVIHNQLSKLYHQNMVYLPFHVEEQDVESAISGAYSLGIHGLNVTVPHKQRVIPYLKQIDPVARAIGAVNTLVRTDGGYAGYNTDMEGLRRAVLSEGICLEGKTVVVLGAGGASKAVVYMCMQEKASRVYLLNRTLSRAQEIADSMNLHFQSSAVVPMELKDYSQISENDLYVFQATSIGLAPRVEEVVIEDTDFYKSVSVGFDLIYNPSETRFIKLVTAAGGRAYNGLKMLLYQGLIAYFYWTGITFDTLDEKSKEIYEALYHAVHKQDNLVLIGFMGAGKTTVGKELAKRLHYDFVDTDAYIEKQAGMKISEIFDARGEAYFRKLETDTIKSLMTETSHTVFATGGGMPMREENARLLCLLGHTVYLRASCDETYERVKEDHQRPLLQCEDPKTRIAELLHERSPIYQACGHLVIDVDGKRIDQIVEEILWKCPAFEEEGDIS